MINQRSYPIRSAPTATDTVLSSNSKPKLSRTKTRKVRTGCITCKKRHIKCDEAKPHCRNCLESRGHCEGYVAKPTKKPASPPIQLCWDSKQSARSASPRMQLQLDPDSLDFRDTRSMLYFQEFVSLVQGPWIAAASNGDLWEVTLPQLARNNNTLRHAAMGIGALSVWHRQSKNASLHAASMPALPKAEQDTHYFHAVAYYCHSLKLQNQRPSPHDALFLSVLFLFFETLRGNLKAALDHVNHGLAMLVTLLADGDASYDIGIFAPNPRPLLGAVADIFTHLAAQARTVLPGKVGRGRPLPNFAKQLRDKKLTMESFMVLLSQLPRSSTDIDRIPDVFNSLDEYEEYWIAAERRKTALGPIMMEIIATSGVFGSNAEVVIDNFYLNVLGHPRIIEFCERSRKTMQALDAAFLPLFNRIIMSNPGSPAYLRAIHLRLQYLGVYIFENPPQYLDVETIQSQTPFFREYLSLAEIALRTAKREIENPAHQLSLQSGLALHLMLVSFFCRDPLARDEAVWMLKDYPGQDGLWSTRSLYILALRNRAVERANAASGTPAEQWQRLWRREYVFENGGDRIVFRYLDKDTVTGRWQLVEEAAEVRGNSEDVHWERQPLTSSGKLLIGELVSL
ncbi:hypothetical protein F4779DRAFT_259484 [Xylariaceae sp. FL0662B]|nr:hypothetical protein F4779DRAFT_259484 [Xylariaceae sp. FL0662B]